MNSEDEAILNEIKTFAEARDIYYASPFGSEMEKKAGEKMFELKPHITKMILNNAKNMF